MQSNSSRPRMPAGFPGTFSSHPHQGGPAMFTSTAAGYGAPANTLPSQSSIESTSSEQIKPQAEMNIARLCRIGQELVHEIVQRSTEAFHILKTTQLPNHLPTNSMTYNDRKKHFQETMKTILEYFKQLKQVYLKVKDYCDRLNVKSAKELVPFVEERSETQKELSDDAGGGKAAPSEAYKQVAAEHLVLTQQLQSKNVHLKDIIDQLRNMLWEVNTMMSLKNANS